jgi:putative membrane protein insertion efficiency factor
VIDATPRTGETTIPPAAARSVFSFFISLPSNGLLAVIHSYQRLVSPMLPGFFGPSAGCRFEPSCSCYAAEAVRRHGAIRGAALTLFRIARCNPLSSGGLDPVPLSSFARASFRPRCVRPNL